MKDGGFRKVQQILLVILLLNLLVAGAKIFVGSVIKSAGMTADGFHSLSDGFSNVVGLIGVYFASQPEDDRHPYGHNKFETLAGMLISIMLFLAGGKVVLGAVRRFRAPIIPEITVESLLLLLVTLVINIVVCVVEYRKGEELNSQILISDSMHTRSDIYISAGVLITLAGIRFGLPAVIDPIVSLAVAGFILHAGYEIFQETSGVLLDSVAVDSGAIREIVMGFEDARDVHDIRSRGSRNSLSIDLHITVDPKLDVETAHKLVHDIEDAVRGKFGAHAQVIAHVEPDEENGT
ncbi:MAG: cation diffusion facilitator family transporter [Bacillota bacterium]|nr:cation transporter [Candidatus Fermentithermobacillaceae bacterium]